MQKLLKEIGKSAGKSTKLEKLAIGSTQKKKTREEKYAEWDKETPSQRLARIMAEGNGPRKVGSDPDEARWYADRKKAGGTAAVQGVMTSAYDSLEKKSADLSKAMRAAVKAKDQETFSKLDKEQKTIDRKATRILDELENGSYKKQAQGQEYWERMVQKLDEFEQDLNRKNSNPAATMTPAVEAPKAQKQLITKQEADEAQRKQGAWFNDALNTEQEAALRIKELTGKSELTGEEKEELAQLGNQWGYMAQAQGGLDNWLESIEAQRQAPGQTVEAYKAQEAQRDMSLTEATDKQEADKNLENWKLDAANVERIRVLEQKQQKDGLSLEEELELNDLKDQYKHLTAYARDKGELDAFVQENVQAAEKQAAEAKNAHHERVKEIEGTMPGYEEAFVTYKGFDKAEWEKAAQQQNFENDLLSRLYAARNQGLKVIKPQGLMEKPMNLNVMIAQLEQSTIDRAEAYRENYEQWKEETLAGQAQAQNELAKWQEQRQLAEAAGDGKSIKVIDKKIEDLQKDVRMRGHSLIQMNEDFPMYAMPREDFAREDQDYWLINWDRMTDIDPTMNPYGYRENEDKTALYERLLAMDATYDPKLFFMTDEERAEYNYYYYWDKVNGTNNASVFMDDIDERLTYRKHNYNAQRAYELGKESPALALLANAVLFPLDAMGTIRTGVDTMLGRETNPYAGSFDTFVARTMGTAGGEAAFEPKKANEFMPVSKGEQAMSDLAKGMYNVLKGVSEITISWLMKKPGRYAMDAAASTAQIYDTLTRGGGNVKGLTAGMVAAFTEHMTEGTFDRMGDIIKVGKAGSLTFGDAAKKVMKDFLPEALEELPGNLVSTLLDRWQMGADSAWEQEKRETGKSNKQMWDQLAKDMVDEGLMAGTTGVFMGGLSYAGGKVKARKITRDILDKMPDVDPKLAQSVAEQMTGVKEQNEEELEQFAVLAEEAQALSEAEDPFQAAAMISGKETQTGQLPIATVTGIDHIAGDEAYVELSDGTTANLKNVTFDNLEMRDAYLAAVKQPDLRSAKAFLSSWQESGLPVSVFERAFEAAFKQGREMGGMKDASILNQIARSTAYKAGTAYQKAMEQVLDTPQEVSSAIQERISAMPRALEEGFAGGVVMATRTARLNPMQAVQAALMDEYGKRNGVKYVVVDTIDNGKANGMYKDGVIYVAADSVEGNLTRGATHEGWHYLKESLGADHAGIKAMEKLVLSRLQANKGYDLKTRMAQIKEAYKAAFNQDLSDDAALEEIVADSLFDVFTNKENLKALVEADGTVAEKFVAWVKRFGQQMRQAMRRIRANSPEARAMWEQNQEAMKKGISDADAIVEAYNYLMEEAKERKQQPQLEEMQEAASGKFSIKFNQDVPWEQQIKEYVGAWKTKSLNAQRNHSLVLTMKTYDVLEDAGMPEHPIAMEASTANKGLKTKSGKRSAHGEQGISVNTYLKMPRQMADAKLIIRYKKDGKDVALAFGTDKADPEAISKENKEKYLNKPVCYAFEENVLNDDNLLVNEVVSVHVRTTPEKISETVLRTDPDAVFVYDGKKISRSLNRKTDIIPEARELIGSYLKIYHPDLVVNRENEGMHEYTAGEIEARDVSDRANLTESQRMEKMPKLDENAVFKSRYSLQNTSPASLDEALMENRALRKSLNQAQELLASNKDAIKNDPKAIRQLAARLIEQTQSTYNEALLSKNLRDIFNGLSNAGDAFDQRAAMQDMADLAQAVIEKSVRMDNTLAEDYADLRKELRTTNISLTDKQRAEAAKLYGSYEDFRKQYMGRLRLTKPGNGIDLTSKWTELAEQYPALFKADATEGDMVSGLADVVEALQPTYSNIYSQNMGEAAYDLAMDMWQGFLDVPQIVGQDRKQVMELRENLAELQREHRDTTWKFKRMSQKYAEQENRIANMANQRQLNQEKLQAKAEITRIVKSLSKQLLNPTNQQHIPKRMRQVVAETLAIMNFKTDRTGAEVAKILEDLHSQYLAAAQEAEADETNEGYSFDPDVADLMESAALTAKEGNKPLSKMNLEELQLIRDALRALRHLVADANELFLDNKKRTATAAGDDTIATLNSWRGKNSSRFAVIRAAGDMLQRGLIKPVYFFEQLQGTPIYDAWLNIRKGEAQHTRQMQQAEAYLLQIMRETGYDPKSWKLDEELRIDDEWRLMEQAKGKDPKRPQLVLTKGELMMLYATAKRERNTGTQHLEKGGVEFESQRFAKKEKNARFQIGLDQVQALAEANLTKEQLQYVDRLVEYMSTVCSAQGNVVSNTMYGIDKFKERYYVPFKTVGNYLKNDPAAGVDSRLATGGFTKALTEKAKTPLMIKDFTEVWCEHVEKMSAYAAFALPLEDFNRIYNNKGTLDDNSPADQSVKASIAYALGERGKGYIDVFLKDLNGNNRNPLGSATMLNALTSKAKGVSIGFNLSVAVQQMSAGSRAYAMIDGKYVAAGLAKGLNYRKSFEELKKWAPIAVQKEWGYFDTNMSRSLYDRVTGDWKQKISDAAGWLPQQGDRINWAQIWEAVKLETADVTEFAPGTDEFYKAAAERFTEVIDHTQVADSVLQRAEWARSKDGLTKALVSFMSEPITQYNMLWSAANKFARAKGMEKGPAKAALIKSARKMTTAVFTGMVLNSALQALAAALRDRENEKKVKDEEGNTVTVGVRSYGEKWKDAFVDNLISAPLSMLPFVSDAASMIEGFEPSRMDMQVISKLVKASAYWWDVLSGKKELDAWKGTYYAAEAISYVTGIPVSNLMRDGYAAYNTGFETLNAGLLPGSAWDKGKTVQERLTAAKEHYVMKKAEGDKRKVKTDVYYDMLLQAWFEGGAESKDFNDVLDTMISQGASAQTVYNGFKKKLAETEELVANGAEALQKNDFAGYEKAYTELTGKNIPMQMALEMIKSAAPKEETQQDPKEEMAAARKKFTGAETKEGTAGTAYDYDALITAMDEGKTQNRDRVLAAFRENGIKDSTIRSKTTSEFKKRWLEAENGGDRTEADRIKRLLFDSGLDYDQEDLDKWWEDDAYDRLYAAMEDGSVAEAKQIRQTIVNRTKEDSASWSRITSYYAKKYKDLYKKDPKAAAEMKRKLLQLGMYESTIKKWEKQARETK